MKISNLRKTTAAGLTRVAADVTWEIAKRPPQELYFEVDDRHGGGLTPAAEAFVTAAYLPAMRQGEKRVAVEGTFCPQLRDGLAAAALLIAKWFGPPAPPPALEPSRGFSPPRPSAEPRTASFLSGGVDALCTLRINRLDIPRDHPASIADGIFIHGFDLGPDGDPADRKLRCFASAVERLGEVARDAGLELVPLATNLRKLDADVEAWLPQHGAALAAVGHALSGRVHRVHVASTYRVDNAPPHGSHPMLDAFYSSAALRVVHDGSHLFREDKVRLISQWQAALDNLRVCHARDLPRGQLNCGRCEKCVRTMLQLEACGGLSASRAFPWREITAGAVDRIWFDQAWQPSLYGRLAERLRPRGRDDLVGAIDRRIAAYHKHVAWLEERGWKGAIRRFDRLYLGGRLARAANGTK